MLFTEIVYLLWFCSNLQKTLQKNESLSKKITKLSDFHQFFNHLIKIIKENYFLLAIRHRQINSK